MHNLTSSSFDGAYQAQCIVIAIIAFARRHLPGETSRRLPSPWSRLLISCSSLDLSSSGKPNAPHLSLACRCEKRRYIMFLLQWALKHKALLLSCTTHHHDFSATVSVYRQASPNTKSSLGPRRSFWLFPGDQQKPSWVAIWSTQHRVLVQNLRRSP